MELMTTNKEGKVFSSPEAMKEYLRKHPKSDPRKHTVRKQEGGSDKGKGKGKDVSDQKGFEPLKGLSPKEQRQVMQKALLNLETEKENKGKGKGEGKGKDVSKEKGFEVLKGLSPEAQRKLIQKALGEKKASGDEFWDVRRLASICPSCAMSLVSAGIEGVYRSEIERLLPKDSHIVANVVNRFREASGDEYLSVEEIADLCPKCAFEMVTAGVAGAYRSDINRMVEAAKWNKLPKGWTEESAKKFWNSLTGDRKHKVTACIKKMKGSDISDPGAFCASLADKIDPGWRSE